MLHPMVLVLAVLVQVSECPRNQHMGGERGGTTVNIEFIVSVELGSPCNLTTVLYSGKSYLATVLYSCKSYLTAVLYI